MATEKPQDPQKVKKRGEINPANDAYDATVQNYTTFPAAGCDGVIDLGERVNDDSVFDLGLRVC